jgi:Na+/H+ antiporter NhaD/arsenite permease-like protein
VAAGLALLPGLAAAQEAGQDAGHAAGGGHGPAPGLFWTLPFLLLLLAIAILPLIHKTAHWWEHNRNRLIVALALAAVTCAYYVFRGFGFHGGEPGWAALGTVLRHAILADYIPFIVLLFSLYVISGGIRLSGDIPAHPITNTTILLIGSLMASFVGTTGAAMLLIRPLLQINSERKRVKHTVVFFIFTVANIGGALLPVGDPPLFLGYLRGVPFLWTLHLLPHWAMGLTILLIVYYFVDRYHYKHEDKAALVLDETRRQPLRLEGGINFALLAGVVLAVALLVPGKPLVGTDWVLPNVYLREMVQLGLSGLSLLLTTRAIRLKNHFNYHAIAEVAALFIGIFITMQVPIEILQMKGEALGLDTPTHYFWFTGLLSSFLDNAPTYVVFFETAGSIPLHLVDVEMVSGLATSTGAIPVHFLEAISVGAVFMGANTYIGNGPNFLVKSIAESRGIKMPSFFGYMIYSGLILIPLFVLIDVVFFIFGNH